VSGPGDPPGLDPARLRALVNQVEADVMGRSKLVQVMVDKIFSFSELGFQEVETSRYVTGILRENGFAVEKPARSRVSRSTTRSSKERRATGRATTRDRRSTSPRRSRSRR
jgi:metal-dependent amidase/aminoacylase/carboxypeptidase family protein